MIILYQQLVKVLQQNKYNNMNNVNFRFPLNLGPQGYFDMNVDTKSAVKENLKITILTNIGERVISDVGSSFNFNSFDLNNDLQNAVRLKMEDLFEKFFSFLNLDDVVVTTNKENSSLDYDQLVVNIKYSYKGINNFDDEINILLQ